MEKIAKQVTEMRENGLEVWETRIAYEIKDIQDYKNEAEVKSAKENLVGSTATWELKLMPLKLHEAQHKPDETPAPVKVQEYSFGQLVIENLSSLTSTYEYKVLLMLNHIDWIRGSVSRVKKKKASGFQKLSEIKSQWLSRKILLDNLTESGSCILDVVLTVREVKPAELSQKLKQEAADKILKSNLKNVLRDPLYSDFSFIVKGKEFKVHRTILAHASPVMRGMFASDLEEGRTNKCEVNDIEPEVFESLLQFIYYAKHPESIDSIAKKLFEAAHYYQIDHLADTCKKIVRTQLTDENAVELHEWAHRYNYAELESEALKRAIR